MRFYITKESIESIKASFFPIKSLYVIEPKEIAKSFTSVKNKEHFEFLVNEEVKSRLIYATEKKKSSTIIYINENLDESVVENIKNILVDRGKVSIFVFIDKEEDPKNLYTYFDEVIYFPKHKKMRIIECEPIRNTMHYWVNNIPIPSNL